MKYNGTRQCQEHLTTLGWAGLYSMEDGIIGTTDQHRHIPISLNNIKHMILNTYSDNIGF
jgi:hypothetical protein